MAATEFVAEFDSFCVDETFLGKKRLSLNGEVVYEGDLRERIEFSRENREYAVEQKTLSTLIPTEYAIEIRENSELIHTATYDTLGRKIESETAHEHKDKLKIFFALAGAILTVSFIVILRTIGFDSLGLPKLGLAAALGSLIGYGIGNWFVD